MRSEKIIIATDIDRCLTAPVAHAYNDPDPPVMPEAVASIRLFKWLLNAWVIAVTSRPPFGDFITSNWVRRNFDGMISHVVYEEHYRRAYSPWLRMPSFKGLIALDLGAQVLIDDTPLHIIGALQMGVPLPILFGDYPTNLGTQLDAPAHHLPDWPLVCERVISYCAANPLG